ncbi:hypothetical protein FQZ97_1049890 [compost metagenome]
MASSWPTTRSCSLSSMTSSLSRSPCISLATGMPVARATTSAISSEPTCVRSSVGALDLPLLASLSSASFRRFSSAGSWPYCSSATLLKSPLRFHSSIWNLILSMSSRTCALPWAWAFSACQISS